MQTKNLANKKFEILKELFPNAITESIDEDGKLVRAIDKDVLAQEISNEVVEGRDERYQFTWPEKRKAILNANAPISKTIRPCREESLNFDETENLYIEGDNLEVLKLLQETYLGKVKMIYIDPPYNTGSDFVYNDDFKKSTDEYLEDSGQFDEDGNRLEKNLESNGRFHTDWLNMIYPRLKLARNLLSDDGVLAISMGYNELKNLLNVVSELFQNNVVVMIWKKKGGASNTEKIIGILTEYIVLCFKNKNPGNVNYREIDRVYKYQDKKGLYNLEGIEKTNLGTYFRPTMIFPIEDPKTGEKFYPPENKRWTIGKETVEKYIENGNLFFDYEKHKVKRIKRPEDYDNSETPYTNLLLNHGSLTSAKTEIEDLLGNKEIFDTPKPTLLIEELLKMFTKKDSMILDFFSGSATSAHAVMELNAEDGGNRKFIMVQLPEETDEKSEAYKAGYKNICEIGKERIRRAGKKILEDNKDKEGIENLDIGFRVLKTDTSNMKDVYYKPGELNQNFLDTLTDNIKEDRKGEDLLFQVMLDLGIPLSSKIETEDIDGKEIFIVDDGYLIASFDRDIDDSIVTKIAKREPAFAVFRDSSMKSDSALNNFDQIFERLSPETTRRVI